MFCEKCGSDNPNGAAFCQNCGARLDARAPQTPQTGFDGPGAAKKKTNPLPIIIGGAAAVLVIVLVIALGGGGGDDSEQGGGDFAVSDTGAGDMVVFDDKADIPAADDVGAPEDAEHVDAVDFFQRLSEITVGKESEFTLTEDAVNYINSHPDFFPGSEDNVDAMEKEVDLSVDFPQISKKQTGYSDRLICASGYVLDCSEVSSGNDDAFTMIQLENETTGYNYFVYYLGTLDDVIRESYVTCLILPFGTITFENVSAEYTEAVTGAACYCAVGDDAQAILDDLYGGDASAGDDISEGGTTVASSDPVEAALEQYREIIEQAPVQFESSDFAEFATGNYTYALVQLTPLDTVPTLLLEQEGDSGMYYARVFQYDPESGSMIAPEDILSEGVASAGGYRGGLAMEEDGFGIRVYEFDSGTGNQYIYRATIEYGELLVSEQWSGVFDDDIPEGMGAVEIEWFDATDLSGLDNYGYL